MQQGTIRRNKDGHLEIGGCDAVQLARRFGTPLYVLDEEDIRRRCRAYREAMATHAPGGMVAYAGKALLCQAICRLIAEEGLGLDLVSGGELYTALSAGFPAGRILFHGNNKSPAELEQALRAEVGLIVVDNEAELEVLSELARAMTRKPRILLRLTPGVEAHTHQYIQTGLEDSKFGFGITDGRAEAAVKRALALDSLSLTGFHCHIGSQILDLDGFEAAVGVMAAFLTRMRDELGFIAQSLDLGGGLGIRYTDADNPPSIGEMVRRVAYALDKACQTAVYPRPRLILEPGRSIVGEAGITLYTVGAVKDLPGLRRYVPIDGGMADNPRVALYQALYHAELADRPTAGKTSVVTVTGKCCESGDILIWDIPLPNPRFGDILAVFSSGAYHYSMASNYNRLPRPAMISCFRNQADLIVARESYQDLVRLDCIPARFNGAAEALELMAGAGE